MAMNKKNRFPAGENKVAAFARALSHPARVAILRTLAERASCICGEIVDVLPLAQSTVSQHLKELKEAGLIRGEIEGPRSCYCLNHETLTQMSQLLQGFLDEIVADPVQESAKQ
ncbi:MAG: metalloregulator ArsR/SmtB family transcription factor [Bacteroidota bacterium]